eukprot:symbB.v1.2.029176.t1/scaffold3166.1/size62104/3
MCNGAGMMLTLSSWSWKVWSYLRQQNLERISLGGMACHRPFCFTFFSGSRCAPPYVPQHLASAGRTAAHPSCRWNYHHPR